MNSLGLQRHGLVASLALGSVVLPAEGHAALVQGDAVGCWRSPRGACSATGRPARPAARRTVAWHRPPTRIGASAPAIVERLRLGQRRMLAEELQPSGPMCLLDFFEEAPAEQSRQHPHGQEEPGPAGDPALAVGREPTAGHDAVHVRVVRQRRAPGVQHQRRADARPEVLGIGGDGQQRLGGHVEQQAVDHGLVLVRDVGDRRRQREDHVVVLDRQQIGLPRLEPALGRAALALRAMPVAARNGVRPIPCR